MADNRVPSRAAPHAPQDFGPSLESPAADRSFPPTLERVLVQLLQGRRSGNTDSQNAQALLATPMGYLLENVAMPDARQRIVLLKPAWMSGHFPELLAGESADVQFYTGLKAAW
ncbi:hypothetical protein GSI_07585 [Ganoderma sinense ZZ0214-1]|uniref:Uncharacterized protein n=1 Tax=Ganoderma sinense ZZ0214-1 TaxID=1077348 RepID=A0A2G8S9G9_9APHY|nr:hypothetical protein GSI_07585 [Ganoderma sinense ZZ0214-1]